MQALLRFFIELCALRRAPQDLPQSQFLLGITALADLGAGILIGLTADVAWWLTTLQSATEIAFTLLVLYAVLSVRQRSARFLQAATALTGSSAVLGLAALLPLSLNAPPLQETDLALIGAFVLLGLVIWGIVVSGHIFRHTFDLTLGAGIAASIALEIITVMLVTGLFGAG